MSDGMMVSVRGSLMRKVVPRPGSETISTLPPRRSIFVFTTSMPTPRPEMSLTCSFVDRPGQHDQRRLLLGGHPLDLVGGDQAFGDGGLPHALRVDAAAVVGDLHQHLAGFVTRLDAHLALARLADARPDVRRFNAVVHGIAHHVRQRVGQAFDKSLVEGHLLADDLQVNCPSRCGPPCRG